MPSKYDPETRAKAVRLVRDHRGDYPSEWAAITTVSKRLGMNAETLRHWIRLTEPRGCMKPGTVQVGAARERPLR